jgi:hypothetical protein
VSRLWLTRVLVRALALALTTVSRLMPELVMD